MTGLVAGVLLMMGVLSSCSRFFPGEADDPAPSPRYLAVVLNGANTAFDRGYDVTRIRFALTFSEADAEALWVSTTYETEELRHRFDIETRFFDYYGLQAEDVRPCMAENVTVTNLSTGEEFVVIEAGDCENQWVFQVEGAFDYLIDAGACTDSVTLDDGREIETPCR